MGATGLVGIGPHQNARLGRWGAEFDVVPPDLRAAHGVTARDAGTSTDEGIVGNTGRAPKAEIEHRRAAGEIVAFDHHIAVLQGLPPHDDVGSVIAQRG